VKEGDRVEDGCAGLLGAVLVVLMDQGGHPDTLEVAASTLMRHMHLSLSRFMGYDASEVRGSPQWLGDRALACSPVRPRSWISPA
jgi:hypothetical protein